MKNEDKQFNWVYWIFFASGMGIFWNWDAFKNNILPYFFIIFIPFIWIWENLEKLGIICFFIFLWILGMRLWSLCDRVKDYKFILNNLEDRLKNLERTIDSLGTLSDTKTDDLSTDILELHTKLNELTSTMDDVKSTVDDIKLNQ